jgi:hypothetical protein
MISLAESCDERPGCIACLIVQETFMAKLRDADPPRLFLRKLLLVRQPRTVALAATKKSDASAPRLPSCKALMLESWYSPSGER